MVDVLANKPISFPIKKVTRVICIQAATGVHISSDGVEDLMEPCKFAQRKYNDGDGVTREANAGTSDGFAWV